MSGLATTFETLLRSKNPAVVELWLEALNSERPFLRAEAFEASTQGGPIEIQVDIIRQWRQLARFEKNLLARHLVRYLPGLRKCLDSSDEQLRTNAFAMSLALQGYALIPDFVKLIEKTDEVYRSSAGRILIQLCTRIPRELGLTSNKINAITADFYRPHAVEALAKSIQRFHLHEKQEILTSFLLVAPTDEDVLCDLLNEPEITPLIKAQELILQRDCIDLSDQLLTAFLTAPNPPKLVREQWQQRSRIDFVGRFLEVVGSKSGPTLAKNLRAVESFEWLDDAIDHLRLWDETQQRGLLKVTRLTGNDVRLTRELIRQLLESGSSNVHRECLESLRGDSSDDAESLLCQSIDHELPDVVMEAIRQLIDREVPGSEAILLKALDHPSESVRELAFETFRDHNANKYLASYQSLDTAARLTMGEVVKRVDSTFVHCLRETLKYEARHRKFQALEICSTLNLVDQIEDDLLELLETTDQGLKSQVCRTLGHSRTPEAEVALHRALTDASTEVRAAAQEALATFEESLTDQPSTGRQDPQTPVMTESTS